MSTPPTRSVLGRSSFAEFTRIGEILRRETTGGLLLMGAALVAIVVGFLVYRRMTRGDAITDRGIAGFAGETTIA